MTEPRSRRAPRYLLRLSVRYREKGGVEWHGGTTQNISETGVLFLTDRVPYEDTTVEMRIQMLPVGSQPAAEVVCQGTVVRRSVPTEAGGTLAIALAFSGYRFVRGHANETSQGREAHSQRG